MTEHPPESIATSVMFGAYDLVFLAGLVLFTPYALFKMLRNPAYRAGVAQRLSLRDAPKRPGTAPVWLQAVSLGEVKSVAPIVRKIASAGKCSVHLTTTTLTGFQVANELLGTSHTLAYFPLDLGCIVRRALSRVRPRAVVLFETEVWPNFIRTADSFGAPVLIVNGRISGKSFRYYTTFAPLFRDAFSRIDFAGMQSSKDAQRALALGVRPAAIEVCGNVKFDAAPPRPSPEQTEMLRRELSLGEGESLIVAGSTHEGEESAMLRVYREVRSRLPNVRLLLAPRHPERFDGVEALIRSSGFQPRRRTKPADGADSVILLDTVGELASVYALASIAFVGGSLSKVGGHNIIEPASLGKPVLFGPHMHHFEDVKEAFLSENAALCVNDENQLLSEVSYLLEDSSRARELGEMARKVVEANRGATERYFRAIEKFL